MLSLKELLKQLNYTHSVYYRDSVQAFEPEMASLFRATRSAGAEGMYVYQTNPHSDSVTLPHRPAVLVAEASTEEQAQRIHKSIWNLGCIPFLIIVLPHQIKVYTGFDYNVENQDQGLLDTLPLTRQKLSKLLKKLRRHFSAEAIDTGQLWKSTFAKKINFHQRVDTQLLQNLEDLKEVLLKDGQLSPKTVHALIGKYVYIRYLWDREIITEKWLLNQGIDITRVLEAHATVQELSRLISVLEQRFNGKIFPIDFDAEDAPTDTHVHLTASVFKGSQLHTQADSVIEQLHLDFQAYDFRYIPVETLSAVYEQFIDQRSEKGAYYTPEILADYLLAEIDSVKPLQVGMKILDPACGSGIFLVLAYRRLIEQELAKRPETKLSPEELKALLDGIYGVERERDACYVAEFSLILTLLHYVDISELEKHSDFLFPDLHNTNIFEQDFFDESDLFWQQDMRFDWVIGNPPWVKARKDENEDESENEDENQTCVYEWIQKHKSERPVTKLSVSEAFSWRVTDILQSDGVVALLLQATSLVNLLSEEYRKKFFAVHEVFRITNFANLRQTLFKARKRKGGAEMPAATIVYQKAVANRIKPDILHSSPMTISQYPSVQKEPLTITINENDIQLISHDEAENGALSTWKFALWGNHYDKRAIEHIRYLFPSTLEQFCENRGWGSQLPRQGCELRVGTEKSIEENQEKLEYLPELTDMKVFNTKSFNKKPRYRFSIPEHVLEQNKKSFLRLRGGKLCLDINKAPHIIISRGWGFVIYSNENFIIPPLRMGITAPQEDATYLQALAVYLNASLVRYYLFFNVPAWGVYRHSKGVVTTQVRKIPTPNFTSEQAGKLAALYEELVQNELQAMQHPDTASLQDVHTRLQQQIDETIFNMFHIPDDIATLVTEFVTMRLPLDGGKADIARVTRPPTKEDLSAYAREIRDEMDDFAMGEFFHHVSITTSDLLIECVIELRETTAPFEITDESIQEADTDGKNIFAQIQESIGQQFSQWIYVQRGLRLYDGPRIMLYKSPRLIDWTRTQAMIDANNIIGQAIAAGMSSNDNN